MEDEVNRVPMTPSIVLDLFVTFLLVDSTFSIFFCECVAVVVVVKELIDFKVDSDYEVILTSNECDYHWYRFVMGLIHKNSNDAYTAYCMRDYDP